MPACHEAMATSGPTVQVQGGGDHPDGQDCCDTFCAHACQMPALTVIESAGVAVQPGVEAVLEAPEHSLPLLILSIDHIPLA